MQTNGYKQIDWNLLAKDERRGSDWWIGDIVVEKAEPSPLPAPEPRKEPQPFV